MEHLFCDLTVGGEFNVCGMVFYYNFYLTTENRNWFLVNFLYIYVPQKV